VPQVAESTGNPRRIFPDSTLLPAANRSRRITFVYDGRFVPRSSIALRRENEMIWFHVEKTDLPKSRGTAQPGHLGGEGDPCGLGFAVAPTVRAQELRSSLPPTWAGEVLSTHTGIESKSISRIQGSGATWATRFQYAPSSSRLIGPPYVLAARSIRTSGCIVAQRRFSA